MRWLTNSAVRSHLPMRPLMVQVGPCTTPTSTALFRPVFQAALTERAAKREQHTQRVRHQHVAVLDGELERRRAMSARSVRRSAAVAQAREEAAHMAAMHDRARPWMILVDMCWRLSVIQVCPSGPDPAAPSADVEYAGCCKLGRSRGCRFPVHITSECHERRARLAFNRILRSRPPQHTQDAIVLGREQRKHERQQEHAAALIQRAWRSFEMERRNRQMVHTVREVRTPPHTACSRHWRHVVSGALCRHGATSSRGCRASDYDVASAAPAGSSHS